MTTAEFNKLVMDRIERQFLDAKPWPGGILDEAVKPDPQEPAWGPSPLRLAFPLWLETQGAGCE